MRNIYFISLLFINTVSYGQKFTILELIKLSKCNDDDFDTYVTSKGYKFWKVDEDENKYSEEKNGRNYAYKQDNKNQKAPYFISKINFENGKHEIMYQTHNTSDYTNIKNQLKSNGYKLTQSLSHDGSDGGAIAFVYQKGSISILLQTSHTENGLSEKTTTYQIKVYD